MRLTKDDLLVGVKWIGALVAGHWANIPPTVITLMVFMGLDIVTGSMSAYVQHRISSDASVRGLTKKLLILLLIGAAHLVERALNLPLEVEGVIAIGYIVNEFISIVENVGNAGVPVPPGLMETMKRFQKLRPAIEAKQGGGDAVEN